MVSSTLRAEGWWHIGSLGSMQKAFCPRRQRGSAMPDAAHACQVACTSLRIHLRACPMSIRQTTMSEPLRAHAADEACIGWQAVQGQELCAGWGMPNHAHLLQRPHNLHVQPVPVLQVVQQLRLRRRACAAVACAAAFKHVRRCHRHDDGHELVAALLSSLRSKGTGK